MKYITAAILLLSFNVVAHELTPECEVAKYKYTQYLKFGEQKDAQWCMNKYNDGAKCYKFTEKMRELAKGEYNLECKSD